MNDLIKVRVCKRCGGVIADAGLCGYGCTLDVTPLTERPEGTVKIREFVFSREYDMVAVSEGKK